MYKEYVQLQVWQCWKQDLSEYAKFYLTIQ